MTATPFDRDIVSLRHLVSILHEMVQSMTGAGIYRDRALWTAPDFTAETSALLSLTREIGRRLTAALTSRVDFHAACAPDVDRLWHGVSRLAARLAGRYHLPVGAVLEDLAFEFHWSFHASWGARIAEGPTGNGGAERSRG